VLLRLAYLGVTNALAMLRLLPLGDQAKDAEILALRHQVMVLERQSRGEKVRFTPVDWAFLAAMHSRLPRQVLRRIRLLVRPDTVSRWHPDLISRRRAARSSPKRPGRPATVRSVRRLVPRLAAENESRGCRSVHAGWLASGLPRSNQTGESGLTARPGMRRSCQAQSEARVQPAGGWGRTAVMLDV
jgi:putative transposase